MKIEYKTDMRNILKSLIVLGISVLVAFSCSNKKEETDVSASEGEDRLLSVEVFEAKSLVFTDTLEFAATIFPNREANLGATLPGRVEKIFYKPGQSFSEGDLLVQMSGEMLVMSEIEYTTIEKDFQRVSNLLEKESINQQDFDHVKAKFDAAKAKYDLMKKNTEITAPFSGVMVEHIVQEGENFMFAPSMDLNFSMTSGIVKIMQINPLVVRFPVNEKLLSKIKIGTPVKVVCDVDEDMEFSGKISMIYPKLNTSTRTADVEVQIPNRNSILRPGMFARVYMGGVSTEGVGVPITSIVRQGSKEFVWLEKNGIATQFEIERLAINGEFAMVSNLEEGSRVIVSKKSQLSEGVKVKID